MSKISPQKKEKIKEEILSLLYETSPRSLFTIQIAEEIIRDNEFAKKLLLELKSKSLVEEIKRSKGGSTYLKRTKWKLTQEAYSAYKKLV